MDRPPLTPDQLASLVHAERELTGDVDENQTARILRSSLPKAAQALVQLLDSSDEKIVYQASMGLMKMGATLVGIEDDQKTPIEKLLGDVVTNLEKIPRKNP